MVVAFWPGICYFTEIVVNNARFPVSIQIS